MNFMIEDDSPSSFSFGDNPKEKLPDPNSNPIHQEEQSLFEDLTTLYNLISHCPRKKPKFAYQFSFERVKLRRNPRGETCLSLECKRRRNCEVQRLLSNQIDFNIHDYTRWTPLHDAIMVDNKAFVELFLKHGAQVNIVGKNYSTPLHTAVQETGGFNRNTKTIEMLVQYGADITANDIKAKTPLDITCPEMKKLIGLTLRNDCIIQRIMLPFPKIYCADEDNFNSLSGYTHICLYAKRDFLLLGDTTHFVINPAFFCPKLLSMAIVQGAFVLTIDKLHEFLQCEDTYIRDPLQYLLNIKDYAIAKAVMNRLEKKPKLFDGISFHFCRHGVSKEVPSRREELKLCVMAGGGKILARPLRDHRVAEVTYPYHASASPTLCKVNYYEVCDDLQHNNTYPAKYRIVHKTINWFVNCACKFEIQ